MIKDRDPPSETLAGIQVIVMKHETVTNIFNIIETTLTLFAGSILLYVLMKFTFAMGAWVELDKLL